ncbi:hypothetical protein [Gracilimonas sp. BCB1]|uniref:hypothetical protein n=1 Tax=Gracilimonas sp. BCB1 TaxID=3152362 RepID=UPI0032D99CB2
MKYTLILLLMLSTSVCAQDALQAPDLNLPHPSISQSITGSDFLKETASYDYLTRQKKAISRILEGSVPSFQRDLIPVQFRTAENETATIWVTCDYISIGTNDDFIRVPLSMPSAREVARATNMYLPTAVMVDSVYAQAHTKLNPIPMEPGEQMRSNNYYRRHNEMIEEQLEEIKRGLLIAGHKKDLVVTNRLAERTGRVAIYGWHYAVDDPIQPVSTVHNEDYEDYSHGLRLVHPIADVNGETVKLKELINHPDWGGVFTKEKEIDIKFLSHGE